MIKWSAMLIKIYQHPDKLAKMYSFGMGKSREILSAALLIKFGVPVRQIMSQVKVVVTGLWRRRNTCCTWGSKRTAWSHTTVTHHRHTARVEQTC